MRRGWGRAPGRSAPPCRARGGAAVHGSKHRQQLTLRSSTTAATVVRRLSLTECLSLLAAVEPCMGGCTGTCCRSAAVVSGASSLANAAAGGEGWQPLFATPQRGKRTRLSDAPAARPDAGASAPAERAHAAGAVTCAAETATPPACAAGAVLDPAAEPQPTPDLVRTTLLPSPASTARVSCSCAAPRSQTLALIRTVLQSP